MEWLVASLLLSVLGMGLSAAGQQKTNDQNQQNMMAQWQREDTTLQRSRADAEAAGFSPLAGLAGQAGAGQLTTLQNPLAAFSGLGDAFNSASATSETARTSKAQRGLIDSQRENMDLINDKQRLDNAFQLARILKELEGIDLHNDNLKADLFTKIGEQIATGVIGPEDTGKIANEFKSINDNFVPHKNDYVEKDYNVRKEQADTAASNAALGWTREANRKAEADREFLSSNTSKETGQKITYSFGGATYELYTKDIVSGQVQPAAIGLDPNANPLTSVGERLEFSKTDRGYIARIPVPDGTISAYYVGAYSNGLPVVGTYQTDDWFGREEFFVVIPSAYGYSLYKVPKNKVNVGYNFQTSIGLLSDLWKKLQNIAE